jgi:hypothetical protein
MNLVQKIHFPKNHLVCQSIYQKKDKTFSINRVWDECIVIANITSTTSTDLETITNFEILNFIENGEKYVEAISFDINLSQNMKQKISDILRDSELWKLHDLGWTKEKEIYFSKYNYTATQVPMHVLELTTQEIELISLSLSKDQFLEYKTNGMSEQFFNEDLRDNVEESGPIFSENLYLEVDGIEIPKFCELIKEKYKNAIDDFNSKFDRNENDNSSEIKYAVVGELFTKRSYYGITIYEDFDIDKINFSISKQKLLGRTEAFEMFEIYYDNRQFEFIGNSGASYDNFWLAASSGEIFDFNIIEDQDEDEDDNDEFDDDDDE